MKSLSLRTIAPFLAVLAQAVLVYFVLAVSTRQSTALSVGGVVLICGSAFLLLQPNEKKLWAVFVGLGLTVEILVDYFLRQYGLPNVAATLVANVLFVLIVISGVLSAEKIARRLWRE